MRTLSILAGLSLLLPSLARAQSELQILDAPLSQGSGEFLLWEFPLAFWMEQHGYVSIEQLKGSLSRANCPDPSAYERANYMRSLISYSGKFV